MLYVIVPVIRATIVKPVQNRFNVTEDVPEEFVCKTSPCRPEGTVIWYKQRNCAEEEITNDNITSSYVTTTDNLTITQSTLYYNASINDMEYREYCVRLSTMVHRS